MFCITDPGNIHIRGSVREDRPEYIIALDPGTDGIGTAALDCSSFRPVQYGGNSTRLLHERGDAKERRAIKGLSAACDRKRRRKRELSEILDGGMIITPPKLIPLWREKDKSKSQELTIHLTVGILKNPETRIPPEVPGTVLWQYTHRRGYTCFKGEAVAGSQEEILEQLEPVLKKFGIEIRKSSVSDLQELTKKENFSSGDFYPVLEKVFIDFQNAASECRSAILKLLCGQLLDAGLIWPGLKDRNIRIDLRSVLFVHERDTVADELPDMAKELCCQLLNLLRRLYCRITLKPVMQG